MFLSLFLDARVRVRSYSTRVVSRFTSFELECCLIDMPNLSAIELPLIDVLTTPY